MQEDQDNELLANIKARLDELAKLLDGMNEHWNYEDKVYRFYHHSFKVYYLQDETKEIVEALKHIAPKGTSFCQEFEEILKEGASGLEFDPKHNNEWTKHTRPFVEAFFHARFFLEMAVKYGKELTEAPQMMPSGWASLLSLYGIR